MADTYAQSTKARRIEQGAYSGDPEAGEIFNSGAIDVLDANIGGIITIDIGSNTIYFMDPMANGDISESHYYHLIFIGTPASPVQVIVDDSVSPSKDYLVENQTGQILTFKYFTTEGVTVPDGATALVKCDGVNVRQYVIGDEVSQTEIDGDVPIIDASFPPGHLFRYGGRGNGIDDDTDAWNRMLIACSGAPYGFYVPRPENKYIIDQIVIPSDVSGVVELGTIIEANPGFADDGGGAGTDRLFDFDGAENVDIQWNGAVCRMLKSEYVSGEHRHVFNLVNCTNITLRNPYGKESGGDIYYMNGFTNLTLINPIAELAKRNNYSLIGGTQLRILGVAIARGATGTAPECGFVIEPNSDADELVDIVIETILSEDNDSHAFSMFLDDYKTGTPGDVSIAIGKIISRSNGGAACRIRNCFVNAGNYGGIISIGSILSDQDATNALFVEDKGSNAALLHVGKVIATNPCTGSSSTADVAAVRLSDTSATASGGIHIDSISVKATHSDMDWGLFLECGGGFTDTRVNVENITGFAISPIRFSGVPQATVDASDIKINHKLSIAQVNLTSNTVITPESHYGRVVTNQGASGAIALTLDKDTIPPKGHGYVFRVLAAHLMTIDVETASDQITGTSAPAAEISCDVVGEEVRIEYIGVIGGVRFWQAQIFGNPDNWTFN